MHVHADILMHHQLKYNVDLTIVIRQRLHYQSGSAGTTAIGCCTYSS